jgi:hypothetical protein
MSMCLVSDLDVPKDLCRTSVVPFVVYAYNTLRCHTTVELADRAGHGAFKAAAGMRIIFMNVYGIYTKVWTSDFITLRGARNLPSSK